MKKTTKQIKLADVFNLAADKYLRSNNSDWPNDKCLYSCCAVVKAAKELSGEKENLNKAKLVSELWINYNLTQWSKRAKAKRPTVYAALKFVRENGCITASSNTIENSKMSCYDRQDFRYAWLKLMAQVAEEECLVVHAK
jgi:hypothetical protein